MFTSEKKDSAAQSAQASILKAGALQEAIFKSAHFSCIATDAQGVIQLFNAGAERMLGYAAADVINHFTPADISDADEIVARAAVLSAELGTTIRPGLEALVFKASRGIDDHYELTYIRKDGSRLPAVVSVTGLRDAEDKLIGFLLIGTNNTAGKTAEAEQAVLDQRLREQHIELKNARAAADKANRAKSEFLSNMSHELRTPLNAVLGFAQLMETATPLPTPAQKLSIEQILKGGWYLLQLINEILDLAMIESGKVVVSQEAMSLTEVLQDCQVMIEPQAQARNIAISFPAAGANGVHVHADRTRVKQVLINLLSNAIKYNREGGSVSVHCMAHGDGRVRVSVCDTGAGLEPEQLAQLFQPFNRLGQAGTGTEGTGIGLVVTKHLVELMGGAIGVESSVGAGSTFWFDLAGSAAPSLVPSDAVPSPAAGRASSGLRTVLYVEDNPANLDLVVQLMARRTDLKLLVAIDGPSGVALARSALPDLIFMDLNLPGISGHEALQMLLADPLTSHIPVVALSANAGPRDIEKAMAAGFYRYLTKPFKINEFMLALDATLEHAARVALAD